MNVDLIVLRHTHHLATTQRVSCRTTRYSTTFVAGMVFARVRELFELCGKIDCASLIGYFVGLHNNSEFTQINELQNNVVLSVSFRLSLTS